MTDPIADMLSRIRNAVTAKGTRVDMPASRLKAEIARILQDEGYIQGFKLLDDAAEKTTAQTKTLRLFLKYGPHGERLITGVQRISRPGRRVYFGKEDVPEVLGGPRHEHSHDIAWRDDRSRRRQGRRRRGSALQHLVALQTCSGRPSVGRQ